MNLFDRFMQLDFGRVFGTIVLVLVLCVFSILIRELVAHCWADVRVWWRRKRLGFGAKLPVIPLETWQPKKRSWRVVLRFWDPRSGLVGGLIFGSVLLVLWLTVFIIYNRFMA